MADLPLVAVRGSAVLEVEPDLAVLSVSLRAQDRDRETVLARLDERARAVDAALDGFTGAVERVETTQLQVSPRLKDDRSKERVTGYDASVRKQVTVVDFSRLGEL